MSTAAVKEQRSIQTSAPDLKKELVNGLFVLFRTAELYDSSHPSFQNPAQQLFSVISRLQDGEGKVDLETLDGHLFVNDLRLKFDLEGYTAGKFLIGVLASHHLGGLSFEPRLTQEELNRFVFIFKKAPEDPAALLELFEQEKVEHIVPKTKKEENLVEHQTSREAARKTFTTAVALVETAMSAVRAGKRFNLPSAKRVVQELVDQVVEDEAALMELAALLHFDDYTYAHSVNVAVLSVTLGTRLGLDKKALALLGFAALFHDIGKVKLPLELLNKPDDFDEEDWKQMRRHPVLGAKTLMLTRGTDEFTARAAEVAFMHHINYDTKGYPVLSMKRVPGIFPMIVKICDTYEALTSGRVYFKTPFTPDEVLQKLIGGMGTMYDPLLLKIFVSTIGVFPVGSLVLLDTNEIGIVYKTNPDNIYRPKVRVIVDAAGQKTEFTLVDLSERDQASGQFSRNIKRLLNSQDYGINLSRIALQ